MTDVAALLLAAGAGRRMGRPKGLLRDPDGTPWVARSAGVLLEGGCDPLLVVVGAAADEVAALVTVADLPGPACRAVRVVRASDWAEGMGASLRAGLSALTAASGLTPGRAPVQAPVQGVVVGLVDTPGVTVEVVRRLVGAASPSVLARAAYGGVPGHPVLLGRDHWAGVVATARGDAGARTYLAAKEVLLVECGDVGSGDDVDRPAGAELPIVEP
jgi:nicotine blue oxidoreductase